MKKSLLTAVALAAAVAFSAPVMANAATTNTKPAVTHTVHKKAVKHHVRKAKACHPTKKHHCPTVKHMAKAKHTTAKKK